MVIIAPVVGACSASSGIVEDIGGTAGSAGIARKNRQLHCVAVICRFVLRHSAKAIPGSGAVELALKEVGGIFVCFPSVREGFEHIAKSVYSIKSSCVLAFILFLNQTFTEPTNQ